MQKRLEPTPRNFVVNECAIEDNVKPRLGGLEESIGRDLRENTNIRNTSLNPPKESPGVSFSLLFRFLLVSKIYRRRMALFCRRAYSLETNVLIVLTAASEGHRQQGILARSLGINKNAMVTLVDKLELLRLIKRVRNPDNQRERFIECTLKGRNVVWEIKTHYPEIARWGLFPLSDPQIEQFGTVLARIIEGESLPTPPLPLIHCKKTMRTPVAHRTALASPKTVVPEV